MGEEEASEVFKQLTPKEVQKLGETIARHENRAARPLEAEVLSEVLGRWRWSSRQHRGRHRRVREEPCCASALGEDKANLLIDRILQGNDTTGIEGLKWMDPATVAELLRNEHPQIVCRHPGAPGCRPQPRRCVKCFTERQRNEVLIRIATLDGIQPVALK